MKDNELEQEYCELRDGLPMFPGVMVCGYCDACKENGLYLPELLSNDGERDD